jgi:hypothetical protein
MARAPYTINFRFVGNAQSQTARRSVNEQSARDKRGRFQKVQEMFNTIVEDVALNAADRTYKNAKASLERSVAEVIQTEITQMARMIGRFLVQPEKAFGPAGVITSKQTEIAQQTRSLYGRTNVLYTDIGAFGSKWGSRGNEYLKRKKAAGFPGDWWLKTGKLREQLSSESLYKELGPVSVSFVKTGGTVKNPPKQTLSGRKGRLSATYQVGMLSVKVMERVTLDMLGNALNGGNNGKLVPSLFHDKKLAGKLLRRGETGYRPVLEPFLSYYLTRAIPNAVFNRTEKLISDTSVSRASRMGGGRGSEAGMGYSTGRN